MEKEQLVKLVSAAQNGDSDAQSELFSAFYNDVYFFALKTVKDEDLACDITQEAFIEIINTLGSLKEPAAFVTWMKQITYHQCTRYFKKKKDVIITEDEEGHSIFDDIKEESAEFIPDEALDQSEFKKTILAMLDTLSEEQRSATLLYYFDEMSVSQIAEIQGVSEGTVKSRLNYARKALKGTVEDYEKKNGIKLHSIAMFPLIKWVLSGGSGLAASKVALIAKAVSAGTGASIAAGAAGAAATGAAAAGATAAGATAAGAAATAAAATGISAKVVASIVAGTLLVGGAGTAVVVYNNQKNDTPPITSSIVDTGADVSSDIDDDFVPNNTSSDVSSDISSETPVSSEDATSSEDSDPRYTVPAGATYITVKGERYAAGEKVPSTALIGDTLITEDYTYFCGYVNTSSSKSEPNSAANMVLTQLKATTWSVRANDTTKSAFADVLSAINGQNVSFAAFAFYGCENITVSPRLPDTVTSLKKTFSYCTNLTTVTNFPSGITNLDNAFYNCTSLTTIPTIPDSVVTMDSTFAHCERLTSIPNLPASLKGLQGTFAYCYNLTAVPTIPSGVESMSSSFYYCHSLKTVPNLPYGIGYMANTFENCKSLMTIPKIPRSVNCLDGTFSGCSSLRGVIEIDALVGNDVFSTFLGTTKPITLIGSSPNLAALAATANNGNVTVGS